MLGIIPKRSTYEILPRGNRLGGALSGEQPTMLIVNGILCFSANEWQIPMCVWGNTNSPERTWGYYHYDADALLTGFWQAKHADELYAVYKQCGSGPVDVTTHSDGHAVLMLALQRHPDMKIRTWFSLAGADYPDCIRNGINDCIKNGQIGRIIFGISEEDGILGSPWQWFTPFFWGKTLGLIGPVNCIPTDEKIDWLEPLPDPTITASANYTHMEWTDGPNLDVLSSIVSFLRSTNQ